MACEKCPSDNSAPKEDKPTSDHDKPLVQRLLQVCTKFLPEGTALLSSSCCWLPTALDFLFAGSVTAAGVDRLRNALLSISIVGLIWGVRREGFSRRMVLRILICFGLLGWAQRGRFIQTPKKAGSHSCH